MEFEKESGRPFHFRIINDGAMLKINNNIRISKVDIEDALYYWPNTRAIKMLNNGNVILSLLYSCRDIADEIIRRNIA